MSQKEKLFFDKLKDIFIGTKIEGDSGFINLMQIKSIYFDVIFKELTKDIEEKVKEFPAEFREEMFDKLYSFFKTYFSESGSIHFSYTPLKSKIYEKVYTSNKDVVLFWKTQMLYYVKTERLWKNLITDFGDDDIEYKARFDVSKLEHKKANEKKNIIYELESIKDKEIIFKVLYSENGRQTKTDEIIKKLEKSKVHLDEEKLNKTFHVFEKQNEVDYFINKDAEKFLKEQFELWIKEYVLDEKSIFNEKRLKELKALKDIAYKVIDFVAQFEEELVKIWNKPKFVLNSNYVITLDRIKDIELIQKVVTSTEFKEQEKEWKDLGILDKFEKNDLFTNTLKEKKLLSNKYSKLPIDTKHFSEEIKLEILSKFEDLDKELDGWLIHSENYQALKTILPKFNEKIQTCYVDPPFNTGSDFEYLDNYQDSSWLTLMDNRLSLSRDFLKDSGSIFLHLDHNADYYGRILLNKNFEKENFVNEIIWRMGWVSGYKTQVDAFVRNHDVIFYYAKDNKKVFFNKKNSKIPYKSFNKNTIEPEFKKILEKWGIEKDKIRNVKINIKNNQNFVYKIGLETKDGEYNIEDTWNSSEYEDLNSNKIKRNVKEYTPNGSKITQKPEELLKRIIELTTKKDQMILDFFLGTATSIATAHKLGRKWIGIELGNYFNTDCLWRMKHVLAGFGDHEPCGISKEINWSGGGFFKYYEIEQYEQTLRRCKYAPSSPFLDLRDKSIYQQYIFMKDLKLLEAMELDYSKNKIKVDYSSIYPNIDLAETLSNITGKWIKRISKNYVEFEDGEKIEFNSIRFNLIKPLIWW